jgi:hypothetical protein
MKKCFIAFALILVGLTGCQSVPAERKANCSCNWETLDGFSRGARI